MQTLQVTLPDFVSVDAKELLMLLASKLYEKGTLSLGQAAELAGVSKRTFIELLGNYGVSLFNYPPEDLARDLENA